MNGAGVGSAMDDQRHHLAAPGLQRVPAARQTGQVHRLAIVEIGRYGRHSNQRWVAAPAHGCLQHAYSAPEEHTETVAWRGLEAADQYLAAKAPQRGHRGQANAQLRGELAQGKPAHTRQCLARCIGVLRRHHDDRTVAPEKKRQRSRRTQVLQRCNSHCSDKIHRLMLPVGNRHR